MSLKRAFYVFTNFLLVGFHRIPKSVVNVDPTSWMWWKWHAGMGIPSNDTFGNLYSPRGNGCGFNIQLCRVIGGIDTIMNILPTADIYVGLPTDPLDVRSSFQQWQRTQRLPFVLSDSEAFSALGRSWNFVSVGKIETEHPFIFDGKNPW
jgi:hypothetical protein